MSSEDSKTSPWTHIAKYKLMVEHELAKLNGYKIISVFKTVLPVVNVYL